MRKYRVGIVVLTFAVLCVSLRAAHGQSGSAPSSTRLEPSRSIDRGQTKHYRSRFGSPGAATSSVKQRVAAYTLPPDVYKKARDRSQIRFRLALVSLVYGLFVLWITLHWRVGVKYRDWAERLSRKRFLQAMVFCPSASAHDRRTYGTSGHLFRSYREEIRRLCRGMEFVELGLDQRAADLAGDFPHPDLASLHRDSEKPATLVVSFLAGFNAYHRLCILYNSVGD
jgi:hypothetical protein